MIAFLGSFRFALILIALSAFGVITGTFLESRADSHGVAEDWIYHNPLFQVLLGGYFINILFSTLSRYPFKRRHIPFIITHIGLLMIIAGVFVKSVAGTQGHLQLIEGSSSDELILPNQRALWVKQRFPEKTYSIPENELAMLEYYPHGEEQISGWIKDDAVHLIGFPPLPLRDEPYSLDIGEIEPLNVYTKKQNTYKNPYVLIEETTFSTNSYVAYDQGFGGYTLQAEFPFTSTKELIRELNDHAGSGAPFSPPLELIKEAVRGNFGEAVVQYLKEWEEEGTFLSSAPFPYPLGWESVPQNRRNALYLASEYFEDEDFLEHLHQNSWPLEAVLSEMWELKDDLPLAPSSSPPQMLSAYLRLYGIHLKTIPYKTITLETPLFRKMEPKNPPVKKEDQEPLILIAFEGTTLPLLYDSKASRLKTPAGNGRYLLNYQPHRIKLPYEVRLHEAKEVKYPDSDQTASYECRLTLTSKETQKATAAELQMNQVYETSDGYRFYLAGMGKVDSYGVRSVQLVVNKDPAKWYLTYPGAVLLSIGIISLFYFLSFFK